MSTLLEGIGIAIVILAICLGFKGCMEQKPFIGEHGSFIDTYKTEVVK